jgi:CRP-like cAMP-binding protein
MPKVSSTDDKVWYYEKDEIIIREGEPSNGVIYILNDGELGIFKSEDMVAKIQGPDVFFGEISTILETPRTATVKALRRCKITAYSGGVQTLIRKLPSVAEKLLITLAKRLAQTTEEQRSKIDQIRELEEKNSTLQEQLDGLKSENEELQTKLDELNQELDQLKKRLTIREESSEKRGKR